VPAFARDPRVADGGGNAHLGRMVAELDHVASALADRYEVLDLLGAGGMATVYRARDLRHNRAVAVKVLRPELAAVLGTERFLKEIEVTANLQHPHILPLFDSGEAAGFPYYVMPLIEGESLRERLDRDTQLPIEEALAITCSVASALAYAHGKGVVHRDIKPANILLHDGQPLVADFGIALAVTTAGGRRLTETGLSIGTPEYMSPEQASGSTSVDARTDQYALGCVCYEMLTGEPPHTGPTALAVIAKALADEPRRITAARATVPVHIEFAVHRALSKLPVDRFTTTAGFADALRNPKAATGWLGSIPALVGSRVARRWATRASMVLLATAAVWGWMRSVPPPLRAPIRFDLPYPGGESWGVSRRALAISPDGSLIAFAGAGPGQQQLYLRPLGQLDASVLPGTDGALDPFFSPDGQWVAYATVMGLMKVPASGGLPATILEFPEPRGATWEDDGRIYFGSTSGLWRVPATGGVPEQITTLDTAAGDRLHGRPALLPGGTRVLFTITRERIEETQVAVLSLGSGEVTELVNGIAPHFSPTGHLVYGRQDGVLMAIPFDPGGSALLGAATPVVDGITVKPTGEMDVDFSATGVLVYLTGAAQSGTVVLVDRAGNESPLIAEHDAYVSPRFSPRGDRVALGIGAPPTRQIWTLALADGLLSPVTFEGHNYYPIWSPDGERLAFTTETESMADLRWKAADGTGTPERILTTGELNYPEAWSPDGRYLVFREQDARSQHDLWLLPLGGVDRTPRRVMELPSQEEAPAISPDGRWLAFASDLSGRFEVYVTPFPEAGARIRVSTDGGGEPVWSRDGSELFYWHESELLTARVATSPEFRVLDRTVLFAAASYARWPFHSNYDVDPAGRRFVMVRRSDETSHRIVVVLNWFEALRRQMGGPE